jgi:hypothetical protein
MRLPWPATPDTTLGADFFCCGTAYAVEVERNKAASIKTMDLLLIFDNLS